MLDPVEQHVAARGPEVRAVLRPEVDGIDVLILLRRILRVLERAVRPDEEPVRVLPEPRVVRGALERVVERDLDAELVGTRDEAVEVLHRAEPRIDRIVAAVLAPDRPRAPGIVGARHERVVLPLAIRDADRMNRREIHRIEPELGDARELLLGVGERSVPARDGRRRPRKELVPRREARQLAIDDDLEVVRVAGEIGRREVRFHERQHLGRERERNLRVLLHAGGAQRRRHAPQIVAQLAELHAPRGGIHEIGALEQLRCHVLPRAHLLLQLGAPRAEAIRPRLHRVRPATDAVERERARPAIAVVVEGHGGVTPLALARRAIADARGDEVVPILEDVGADAHLVADHALDREPPAIERRCHAFDREMRKLGGGSASRFSNRLAGWHSLSGTVTNDGATVAVGGSVALSEISSFRTTPEARRRRESCGVARGGPTTERAVSGGKCARR